MRRCPALLSVVILAASTLLLHAAENPRVDIVNAMILRPDDPWPRGRGHVILAKPGSSEEFKAYHEPGGSFSPSFGSFGISLWVTHPNGRRIATSDSIPLDQIDQQLFWPPQPIWPKRPSIPAIRTVTPHYQAIWSALAENRWQLRLQPQSTNILNLLIRSVGPAAGPIRSLVWFPDNRLFVNDRWVVSFSSRPATLEIVPPTTQSAPSQNAENVSWPAEQPWGYARFSFPPNLEQWITLEDAVLPPHNPLKTPTLKPLLNLQLPHPTFLASLEAQVAHIMMGLVRNETRPGDPNNYPLNWLRDGAYSIVALARAGHLDLATDLAPPFAERDFFGGFGAEADAPGLALWALTELAAMKRDPKFDQSLWPHLQRKASLILDMLSTETAIRKPFHGPVVPSHTNHADLELVCDPARDGLIMGRMDWHRPILFVNAVSYRGLVNAAQFASRLNHTREAQSWQSRADSLRQAWNTALNSPEADNERTYIAALHPTWVVSNHPLYQSQLAQRRTLTHNNDNTLKDPPLWTYFTLAQTHQWLSLGRPDFVWNDLNWFWNHQASPGLFTWWEGDGEENSFGRWKSVRGWITPPHVTPHYWTAAEMLLLQLDMLVCLDESGPQPLLRIGAGVPDAWLQQPLRVDGIFTRLGRVDWQWAENRLSVRLRGFKCDLQPGPAFPNDIELRVR
jgi:hypothetical protein